MDILRKDISDLPYALPALWGVVALINLFIATTWFGRGEELTAWIYVATAVVALMPLVFTLVRRRKALKTTSDKDIVGKETS